MTTIQRLLNKSSNSANEDCRAFNMYYNGEITIEECLEKFYANNRIPNKDRIITVQEFKNWLKGLGYAKYEED